jgi:ABC-type hemin transport system ATPase subunit
VKRHRGGDAPVKQVVLRNVDVRVAGKTIVYVYEADLTLAFGRQYSLVGRNGASKSLLRAMAEGDMIPRARPRSSARGRRWHDRP